MASSPSYENPFEEVALGGSPPPVPAHSHTQAAPPPPTKLRAPTLAPEDKPLPIPKGPSINRNPYVTDVIVDMNAPIDLTWDGIQRKERELDMREQALEKRDNVLQNREKALPRPRPKNWPICRPIIHHDIEGDIEDADSQTTVKRAYIGWMFECGVQIWNTAALLAYLIVGNPNFGGFILSIGFLLWEVPISFCIYRLLYQAARKRKPTLYVLYFIFLWWSVLWAAYFFIGIDAYGGGGFFSMIGAFKRSVGAGVCGIICMVGWGVLILWHIYIFFLARRQFSALGGLQQAKADVKEGTVGQFRSNRADTGQSASQFA